MVVKQLRFFIQIFIFASFWIFHQTHDSTFFWMSPKFFACNTSWSRESIFRNITFLIPIEYRFCGRNHFFCQSFSKFYCIQRFIQNTSPFLLFQTQPLLLFSIDCISCSCMTPLPLFVRNCVKSLHHFFIRFVFAFF